MDLATRARRAWDIFKEWIGIMGDKAKKAVETVREIGGEAVGKLVGAGEAVTCTATEIVEAVRDIEAAATDRKREKAEAFAGRAEAQRQKAAETDAKADYARALDGRVANFAGLGDSGALELRFADGTRFIGGAIEAPRDAFKGGNGANATYQRTVDFAPDGEPFDVTEAWLVAGSWAARCELGAPLKVGGGHQAQIPAGFLLF